MLTFFYNGCFVISNATHSFAIQSTFNYITMNKEANHLEELKQIRSIMERSSRFISLSGLSGVFAGIYALLGAGTAYFKLNYSQISTSPHDYPMTFVTEPAEGHLAFFLADATLVLMASLTTGLLLTWRSAKKNGQTIWDATAQRMLINLLIPLVTGGLFTVILIMHGLVGLVAPATLIFYGLALINASKYTLNDIRYLGICEIILGLLAAVYIGQGLLFWATGFGFLHIVYGLLMYNKYER